MKRNYCIVFADKHTQKSTRKIEYFGTFKKAFEYATLCCCFDEYVGSVSCRFYPND